MRKKEEILRDMGVNEEYNPHGGILPDTKEVILVEVLIDIRDILSAFVKQHKDHWEVYHKPKKGGE